MPGIDFWLNWNCMLENFEKHTGFRIEWHLKFTSIEWTEILGKVVNTDQTRSNSKQDQI